MLKIKFNPRFFRNGGSKKSHFQKKKKFLSETEAQHMALGTKGIFTLLYRKRNIFFFSTNKIGSLKFYNYRKIVSNSFDLSLSLFVKWSILLK